MGDLESSPRISQVFDIAKSFTTTERLILAKLLLDSLVEDETEEDAEWGNMSLAAFEKDWDNPEDAIYDNWRVQYGVPAE